MGEGREAINDVSLQKHLRKKEKRGEIGTIEKPENVKPSDKRIGRNVAYGRRR